MIPQDSPPTSGSSGVLLFVYWVVVGVPLGWGVYMTALKLPALFH